uniref:Uncharacterized protein n=1 Tax=Anguilla anguilla TaxID=7936 RepID=A0A0E9VHN4_ANGAN
MCRGFHFHNTKTNSIDTFTLHCKQQLKCVI